MNNKLVFIIFSTEFVSTNIYVSTFYWSSFLGKWLGTGIKVTLVLHVDEIAKLQDCSKINNFNGVYLINIFVVVCMTKALQISHFP